MTGRIVLFSAQKNEGPFILEWVAYHKVIGFTDIVVVSNDCTDGSDDLLDALQDAGELTHIRQIVPDDISPQINAQRVARNKGVFRNGDWVMWLDLDEYLVVHAGDGRVDDLLDAQSDADAIAIRWRIFGDSGREWAGRQLTSAYVEASRRKLPMNQIVKTIFRFSPAVQSMELHTPVLAEAENAETIQFFDSGGRPVPDQFFTRKFASGAPFHRIEQYRGSAKLAQVNHYCIRGSGPFRRKQARGNGYVRADGSDPDRNIQLQHQQDSFYQRMNANDVVDRAVLRHAFRTYRSTEAISEVVAGSIGEQTAQTSPPVSLYWYDKTPNFGDLLGPLLVGAVTGRDVVASKSDDDKQIASIGSVVSMVRPGGAIIWGSGLIRPPDKSLARQIRKRLPLDVRAVRGKLTAEVLRDQFGVRVPNIFGDPALLFPRFFPFADQRQDGTIVVCPHYSHLGFFPGNAAIEGIKLKVLDVTTDALSVVKKIAGASYCISSSLHGVVIAQAYGVPWVWLRLEDIVLTGDRFKFEDFFSILDRDQVAEVSVASSAVTKDALLDWCKLAWLPDCAPVCDALLENFPYDAVPHRAIPGNEAWPEG